MPSFPLLIFQLIFPHFLHCPSSSLSIPAQQNNICPSKCECQKSIMDNNNYDGEEEENESPSPIDSLSLPPSHLSVRCLRGSMNDTEFLAILQSLPADVRELEIRGIPAGRPNFLHWSDNLNRLSRLRRLSLVDSGLPALSQAIRLPLLSELVLSGNQIEQIQLGSFLGMPMLQRLDLSRNRISSLPTGAFIYLKNLRSLSLNQNRLGADLTTANLLRGPRQLKSLELDSNRLNAKQINDLFPDLGALERLELNNCGLNDAELWTLNLSAVPGLRRIGLAGNNLTQVPSTSLRALAHLETLDIRDNLIRSLGPCSFCGLNISRVLMAQNLLGLTANSIHREAFADTRMLELDLGWNHFRQFHSSMLAGAQKSLEILHLSGNPVEMDGPLAGTLPQLRELHLAHCNLGNVPYSLPKSFHQFTLLNLSSNGLDHLPPNLGTFLPSLRILDISHNHFSSLPHTLLGFIDRLSLVFLHHNQWDCQCAAQPLQIHMLQRLAHRELLHFDETLCAEPPLLRDQPLHRVQKINDCAVLFGAHFGMTQNMELVLILTALLVAAFLFSLVLVILLYCGRENKQKGTYVTGEKQQQMKNMGMEGARRMGNGMGAEMDLDLSPPPPLMLSSATNSSMISGSNQAAPNPLQISPLTVQGLATREQQPLLCSAAGLGDALDFNQNCVAQRGQQLVVQCQGQRHALPPVQKSQTKTLLTF